MKKIFLILIVISTISLAKVQVSVSIPPQAFFVQKVAGDLVSVEVLVKPGSSPATYSPKPSQLKLISDSLIYFTIGVAFEKSWLPRFSSINSKMLIVDTTKNIQKIPMEEEDEHKHHGHHHGELDPHVWLDPNLVKLQIITIRDALIRVDKENREIYLKNSKNFIKELDAIDKEIRAILSNVSQREFIVFHPSFGYFAKAYGLKQIAIEKGGKEPSVRYIKKVIDLASKKSIKTVFTAPQFPQKSAKQIAKIIGGTVKNINPLARDWDKNILDIAKSFGNQ